MPSRSFDSRCFKPGNDQRNVAKTARIRCTHKQLPGECSCIRNRKLWFVFGESGSVNPRWPFRVLTPPCDPAYISRIGSPAVPVGSPGRDVQQDRDRVAKRRGWFSFVPQQGFGGSARAESGDPDDGRGDHRRRRTHPISDSSRTDGRSPESRRHSHTGRHNIIYLFCMES